MQQTEKYKLNLIESSDPFLPDGLNENTLKLEEVVSGYLEGMDARVTVLEGHKLAFGTYQNSWSPADPNNISTLFISTGFAPRFVMAWYHISNGSNVWIADLPEIGSSYAGFTSAENGFYVHSTNSGTFQFIALC